jgi:hypothetical protein
MTEYTQPVFVLSQTVGDVTTLHGAYSTREEAQAALADLSDESYEIVESEMPTGPFEARAPKTGSEELPILNANPPSAEELREAGLTEGEQEPEAWTYFDEEAQTRYMDQATAERFRLEAVCRMTELPDRAYIGRRSYVFYHNPVTDEYFVEIESGGDAHVRSSSLDEINALREEGGAQ